MGPSSIRTASAALLLAFIAPPLLLAQSTPLDSRRSSAPARSKPNREQTDWEIATIVRAAFWQDKDLAPLNLQVSVEQGVATVEGPVPSSYLRRKAIAVVESLKGIRGVRDQVRVRAAPSGAPGARYFPPVDQPWPKKREPISPPEAPLKAPTLQEPAHSGILMSRPIEEEPPAQPPVNDWKPASGQGTWSPASSGRAGLLAPQKSQEEMPKVGLGTPVVRP